LEQLRPTGTTAIAKKSINNLLSSPLWLNVGYNCYHQQNCLCIRLQISVRKEINELAQRHCWPFLEQLRPTGTTAIANKTAYLATTDIRTQRRNRHQQNCLGKEIN
jgi:hypothetical protein